MSEINLEKLWKRSLHCSVSNSKIDTQTWDNEMNALYELGISMEDTLQFLYFDKPDLETFKTWITTRRKTKMSKPKILQRKFYLKKIFSFGINMVMLL